MRWFITKKHLVALIGILVAAMFLMALMGCIPVTVRPEFDDQGLPKALPVTPVGSISPTGELIPTYPVSNEAPAPTNWGAIGSVIGAITTGLLAAYGINLRGVASKAMTALQITAELADRQEEAETPEQTKRNKEIAALRQKEAGVHDLVKKVRGK